MSRLLLTGLVIVSLGLLAVPRAAPATAAPFVFETLMFGTEQVPPVETVGWGFVRFFFNDDRTAADYTVDVKGLSSSLVTGADIHRGPRGVNGAIVHHLADGEFLVTSGHMSFTQADLDEMARGQWYVSLKSLFNPEGEMRGQVVLPEGFLAKPIPPPPASLVPPPGPGPDGSVICLTDCGALGGADVPPALEPPLILVLDTTPATVAPALPAATQPEVPAPTEAPSPGLITPPNTGDGGLLR